MTELKLPAGGLVVFIDETGHEMLPSGHRIYGLGGCAVLEQRLEQDVRIPWREIRGQILGNPDAPLHATDITPSLSREKMELIGAFFQSHRFMRIAAVATVETAIPDQYELLQFVAPALLQRIVEIFKWTPASSISIIFESNPRSDRKVETYFQQFAIGENGHNVPIEGYFMAKNSTEPGLEVADFIMHAVHGLAWDRLEGRDGYNRRDFRSVFPSDAPKLSSFMLMESVTSTG